MQTSEIRSVEEGINPRLRPLLDHIAVELGEEYVRLMEEAVTAESAPVDPTPELALEGGTR